MSLDVHVSAHSVCNALGRNWSAFWAAFTRGERGFTRELPAELKPLPFELCTGAVSQLAAAPFPEIVDTRQARLAWAAIGDVLPALEASKDRFGADRVGLLLGTSTGGLQSSERAIETLKRTGTLPTEYSCRDGHAFDAIARQLSCVLQLSGPWAVVSTACSSSTKALAAARRWLECGIVDAVLVGGVDSLCALTLMGFASLGILASEPCRPLSDELVGMNVAEGAAWLLLERGYGSVLLLGSGETSDAFHMVSPHPAGNGTRRAIEAALASAGLGAEAVSYVNAHATGTAANDPVEARVLGELFGHAHVEASKAQLGHQLGAAGATQAAVCLGRLNQAEPLPKGRSNARVEVALMNTLAFGGANAALVFARGADAARNAQPHSSHAAPRAPHAFVHTATLWAPGYAVTSPSWKRHLQASELPEAKLLGARERGRAALLTQMFAECLAQLGETEALRRLPVVYGSAFGPVHTTLELLEQQVRDECSPLRFQASVHNAPAGILSTALGNHEFYTSVAAGEQTVAAALLEALCWLDVHPEAEKIAVLVGDEAPPQPLLSEDYLPMAAGFLLSRTGPGQGHVGWCSALEETAQDVAAWSETAAKGAASSAFFARGLNPARLRANPCGSALDALQALQALQPAGLTRLALTRNPRGPAIEVRARPDLPGSAQA